MKNTLTTAAALLLTTTAATAGGLDRSGQGIGILFEEGRVAELSYGMVMPTVSGSVAGGAVGSGNVAPNYNSVSLGFKTDIDDKVSVAVIFDQPFGADVDYNDTDPGYPLAGTMAQVKSSAITIVGQYNVNDNISVHFGPRYLSAEGSVVITAPTPYASDYSSGSGTGFIAGAAYERSDIAMRVALTYSSAIALELDGTVGADTLLFGSVRWAEWSAARIDDSLAGPLVSYDEDTVSYTLGVGRRFTDTLSGALTLGYEAEQGGAASNLAPTDGNFSVGLGATYDMGNGLEVTGGVRYVKLGDATTETLGAEFADNSAVAFGLKVGYSF